MHAVEPQLAVHGAGVGVGELHLPEPEALHLAAGEHDAGFEHVEDRVVVPGADCWRRRRSNPIDPVSSEHWGHASAGVMGAPRLPVASGDDARRRPRSLRGDDRARLQLLSGGDVRAPRRVGGRRRAAIFYPCRNTTRSARVFEIHGMDYQRAEDDADGRGLELMAIVHSHTHTEPYPSPTDLAVAEGLGPWFRWVIVSLAQRGTGDPQLPDRRRHGHRGADDRRVMSPPRTQQARIRVESRLVLSGYPGKAPVMIIHESVLDLIGNTPLVDVSQLSPNPSVRIIAKMENQNPFGSVKDRIAKLMIDTAEKRDCSSPARRSWNRRRATPALRWPPSPG